MIILSSSDNLRISYHILDTSSTKVYTVCNIGLLHIWSTIICSTWLLELYQHNDVGQTVDWTWMSKMFYTLIYIYLTESMLVRLPLDIWKNPPALIGWRLSTLLRRYFNLCLSFLSSTVSSTSSISLLTCCKATNAAFADSVRTHRL